jgi:hypothetical protein
MLLYLGHRAIPVTAEPLSQLTGIDPVSQFQVERTLMDIFGWRYLLQQGADRQDQYA